MSEDNFNNELPVIAIVGRPNVGKSTFIKYYYNFKNNSREACIMQFEEPFTDKAKLTRTGHAQRIFREGMNIEALKIFDNDFIYNSFSLVDLNGSVRQNGAIKKKAEKIRLFSLFTVWFLRRSSRQKHSKLREWRKGIPQEIRSRE